jgi:hypothetical protein
MKKIAFALCATFCLVGSSYAQSDATAPESGAAAGKSNKMQELVQSCRKQAMAGGLTPGHELRQAVMDCVVKERPGMANMMKCRMAGMDKGLKPGDDLKTYVKDCLKKNG